MVGPSRHGEIVDVQRAHLATQRPEAEGAGLGRAELPLEAVLKGMQ